MFNCWGGSAAVVHSELNRMRRVLVCFYFFHLQFDLAIDLILGKHVACQQEFVVGLQALHRFAQ